MKLDKLIERGYQPARLVDTYTPLQRLFWWLPWHTPGLRHALRFFFIDPYREIVLTKGDNIVKSVVTKEDNTDDDVHTAPRNDDADGGRDKN